jgi:hypothetical protein
MDALNIGLSLGELFQIGKTDLKILADHFVDVHKHLHHFGYEGRRAMHEPTNVGCSIALRQHGELRGVVGLERLEEIELDDDF